MSKASEIAADIGVSFSRRHAAAVFMIAVLLIAGGMITQSFEATHWLLLAGNLAALLSLVLFVFAPTVSAIRKQVGNNERSTPTVLDGEQDYRALFDNASIGIFRTSLSGAFLSVNPKLAEILGFATPAEVVRSLNVLDDQIYCDPSRRQQFVKQICSAGMIVDFDSQIRRKSGEIGWIRECAWPIRDGAGQPVGFEGIVVDITASCEALKLRKDYHDLKRLTAALAESEARHRALFECSQDAILLLHQGRICEANSAAVRMFGYQSREQLYQLVHNDLSPERQACGRPSSQLESRYLEAAVRDGMSTFSWTYHRACGASFEAHVLLSRIVTPTEVSILATVRDVSQQNADQRRAKESEQRFRLALIAADAGTWTWDLQTNSLDWDNKAYSIFGIDPDASAELYDAWRAMIHPDDVGLVDRDLQLCIEGHGSIYDSQYKVICPSGSVRYVNSKGIVERREDGKAVRITGICVDITDQRERDLEMKAARDEAEAANRAKSQFLASMSHELRTPLNGVIGMTDLLANTHLSDQQERFVRACQLSGETLLSLVNNVLDLSKIEAGGLELDMHPFDLQQLIADVTETMAYRTNRDLVTFRHHVDRSASLMLEGDSHRVRQVLINLLGNAFKFTERGSVTLGVETLSLFKNDATIRFSVADTGIGIPEDRMARVFAEFSQVDASTTRKYGGSGLGLAIAKRIVEQMGGEIGVKSKVGDGSEFWFVLPFDRVAADVQTSLAEPRPTEIPPSQPLAAASEQTLRILLAEDNPTNQMFASEILARQGWQCDVVDNGCDAIEAVESNRYDLVLMDCQMPGVDGYQAAREIRRLEREGVLATRTPIVALTANAIKGDREQCLSSGMDDYIPKPFNSKQLVSTIARLAASEGGCEPATTATETKPDPVPAATALDEQQLLTRCMGDTSFAESMLESFESDSARRLNEIIEHTAKGDALSARQSAHALKGIAGIVAARDVHERAAVVESTAGDGDVMAVRALLDGLSDAVERCLTESASLRDRLSRSETRLCTNRQQGH